MEVQQGNRNCNHSLKREKPARCAGIPLEPLNECCLAVKRMPLAEHQGRNLPTKERQPANHNPEISHQRVPLTTDYCNPSSQQPSRFDLDFVIDGVRHHYGFEASDTKFVSEGLYTFPRSHSRTLFERTGDEFRFGRELRGQNSSIARLTSPENSPDMLAVEAEFMLNCLLSVN